MRFPTFHGATTGWIFFAIDSKSPASAVEKVHVSYTGNRISLSESLPLAARVQARPSVPPLAPRPAFTPQSKLGTSAAIHVWCGSSLRGHTMRDKFVGPKVSDRRTATVGSPGL